MRTELELILISIASMLTISCVVIVVFSKTDIVNATTTLNPAIIIPFVGTTTVSTPSPVVSESL